MNRLFRQGSRVKVQPPYLLCMLLAGFLVYVESVPVVVAYGLGVAALFCMVISSPRGRGRIHALISLCTMLFFLATIFSLGKLIFFMPFVVWEPQEALQYVLYPLTCYGVLLHFGGHVQTSGKALFWFAITAGLLQAVVALGNTTMGPLTLPVVGQLPHGRAIFFTNLPSSTGLFWNVNYYAVSQVMLFWLAVGTRRSSGMPGFYASTACCLLIASSVLGSSRGVVLSAVAGFLAYWFSVGPMTVMRVTSTCVVLGTMAFAITQVDMESDTIALGIRIEKGLNARDSIWEAAVEVIGENMLLGVGPLAGEELLHRGSPGPTAQNTIVASLLRVGVLGTLPWLAATIVILLQGLRQPNTAWAMAATVTWLIDGMVRTYSLGGLGLVPLLAALALSSILWTSQPAFCPRMFPKNPLSAFWAHSRPIGND